MISGPTEQEGIFSLIAEGANADMDAQLASKREALLDFIVEVMNWNELDLGQIIWQSEFR